MNRNNAYDLLRIILSSFVIISHCEYIRGAYSPDIFYFSNRQTYLAELGVIGFFSLSGYLITQSYLNKISLLQFALNRVLRIYPAFWVCLALTAYFIAPLMFYQEHNSIKGYPFNGIYSAYTYLRSNFTIYMQQVKIGDIVDRFNVANINGSLWSLFIELQCYSLTVLLGLTGILKNKKRLLAVFAGYSVVYILICTRPGFRIPLLDYTNAKLFMAYLGGTLYCLYREQLEIIKKYLVPAALAILIVSLRTGGANILIPLLLPVILLGIFSSFRFEIKNDISYGLYIYAFPIQYLLYIYFPSLGIWTYIGLSFAVTAVVALLSYVLVEKPALRLRKPLYNSIYRIYLSLKPDFK